MVHDPDLADRMEQALRERGADPSARKMFGGIAFMVGGNMSFGTSGDEMHVRVGPDAYEDALARPGAGPMEFTGRSMKGWVTVEGPSDLTEEEIGSWADITLKFVRTLPVK
jgi:TfoX/Sxy family transcriptional regulator of competence genes